MKQIHKLGAFLCAITLFLVITPNVFAYGSLSDYQSELSSASSDWWDAHDRGDTQGMADAAARGAAAREAMSNYGASVTYDSASGTTRVSYGGNTTYDNSDSDYSGSSYRSSGGSGSTYARRNGVFDIYEIQKEFTGNSAAWESATESTRQYLQNTNTELAKTLEKYGYSVNRNTDAGTTTVTGANGSVITNTEQDGITYAAESGGTAFVSSGEGNISIAGARDTIEGFQIYTTIGDTVSSDVILIKKADGTATEEGHSGNYSSVGFVSDAMSKAKAECEKRGIPTSDYNVLGMIDELYLGVDETISLSGDEVGMSENGEETDKASGMSDFASFLTRTVDGEPFFSYQETYDLIKGLEESPEAKELKEAYLREQAKDVGPDGIYKTIAEKMATLEAIHQQMEELRQSNGYSAQDGGRFYIPIVGGGDSGFERTYRIKTGETDHDTGEEKVEEVKVKFYSVYVAAGDGGKAEPGTGSFAEHTDATFKFIPDAGYSVESVKVDGSECGSIRSYTIISIDRSHTIEVTFKKIEVKIGTATISSNTANKDGSIKSGYGVEAKVGVYASTDEALSVVAEYDWGYGNKGSVNLEQSSGNWVFPRDAQSTDHARKLYIPVQTKDGTYTIKFTAQIVDKDNHVYSDTQTARVVVKGSMYEDDFTGDRK